MKNNNSREIFQQEMKNLADLNFKKVRTLMRHYLNPKTKN